MVMVLMAVGHYQITGPDTGQQAGFITVGQIDSTGVKDGSLSWSDLPTTVTPFAKTLLDDAAATNARSTLGLGTMATETATTYQQAAAFEDSLHGIVNPEGLADSTFFSDDRLYRWQVGGTVKFGDVVYRAADDDYEGADCDALTTMPAMAVCVTPGGGAATAYLTFMSSGWIKWTGYTNITAASDSVYAYVSTSAGSVSQVKPSGAGDIIQVIGTIHGDGLVHFKPDFTELTVAP